METLLQIAPERLLLLLGLSFFLGLAFEEFYGALTLKPPGGVRTFPLLAFSGAGLFLLEPRPALIFTAGLLVLGAWLFLYYLFGLRAQQRSAGGESSGLVVPIANVFAYVLGPLVLWAPIWVGIGFTVAAVLLLGARDPLHALAHRISRAEITTLGKFLILTGIVLPLLPNQPVTGLTSITPFQVWLAVVAVSSLSYASYLAQRYVAPRESSLLASLLGGLYSSTATTVVLARRMRNAGTALAETQAGIVLATAVMYLRLAVVVGVFNLPLAKALLPSLAALSLLAAAIAGLLYRRKGLDKSEAASAAPLGNPLELSTAMLFALLFVVTSLASSWVQSEFGGRGLYWLAALLGVSDIDPFVLSLAQGSVKGEPLPVMTAAILIAASSNNVLKALYAIAFGNIRSGALPAAALVLLGIIGIVIVLVLVGAQA
ncbi:MAG: MgtC/SapB family protein [Alphaproteobacteria bacterium]